MKRISWKAYLVWILAVEAVGALSGFLSRGGMMLYDSTAVKPALTPPGWVFPVVWGLLFALMGISAARISASEPSPGRSRALNLFAVQLVVNFFWSLLFFNAMAFGFAFLWLLLLWGLVLWMILSFYRIDPLAAWLQVPYLLWLTFAAYLNLMVILLNG